MIVLDRIVLSNLTNYKVIKMKNQKVKKQKVLTERYMNSKAYLRDLGREAKRVLDSGIFVNNSNFDEFFEIVESEESESKSCGLVVD